ncbi:uncharacterized protein B0I36DRAFT_364790 [Microdochium trichocladiopsis]|uniref:Uncharacterized protein n=1 Tax=Microdochium trichocladiopsis TaxID=1682393 RepID=A0A9P9BNN5_9PEZI|nr:uncharacterized protein B0I36DRAFT_364790 [Microdochium trichocladiopsis]KAH7027609.1 hypothetical protein B0I36DRAFT_364790 [Microdochium trichocladiopsis]
MWSDRCSYPSLDCPTTTAGPRRRTSSSQRQSPYPSHHQFRTTKGTFFEVALVSQHHQGSEKTSPWLTDDDDDGRQDSPTSSTSRTTTPDLTRQRSLSSSSFATSNWSPSPVTGAVGFPSMQSGIQRHEADQAMTVRPEAEPTLLGTLITIDSHAWTDRGKADYWMCYTCTRRLPPEDFKCEQTFKVRLGDHWDSPSVHLRRFCIPCGIKLGAHRPGPVFETKHATTRRWICNCLRIHDAGVSICPKCNRLSTPTEQAGVYTFQVSISPSPSL